jgi:hypothetical protein
MLSHREKVRFRTLYRIIIISQNFMAEPIAQTSFYKAENPFTDSCGGRLRTIPMQSSFHKSGNIAPLRFH